MQVELPPVLVEAQAPPFCPQLVVQLGLTVSMLFQCLQMSVELLSVLIEALVPEGTLDPADGIGAVSTVGETAHAGRSGLTDVVRSAGLRAAPWVLG